MERKEMIDKLAAEYLELAKIRVQNDIDLNDVLKAMVKKLEKKAEYDAGRNEGR